MRVCEIKLFKLYVINPVLRHSASSVLLPKRAYSHHPRALNESKSQSRASSDREQFHLLKAGISQPQLLE